MKTEAYDVVVAGSGNAALAAAVAAREGGARTLVIEKAPHSHRGGNSRFSSGAVLRFTHRGGEDLYALLPQFSKEELETLEIPPYTADDYYGDLMKITRGLADPDLTALLANESYATLKWMIGLGIRIEPYYAQAMRSGDKFRWTPGRIAIHATDGGAGLVEGWLRIAQEKGIEVRYETRATKLLVDDKGAIEGLQVLGKDGFQAILCRTS